MAGAVLRGFVAAALLAAAACGHPAVQSNDGSAIADAPGEVLPGDAPSNRLDLAASDATPDVAASDGAFDTAASDAGADGPPPPGFIACGRAFCDPAAQYCQHITGGLTGESYTCAAVPVSCAGQATACACLTPDGGPSYCACKAVTGTDATGFQLDCPGPVG